jgi:anthranilate synthase component 1
VVADSNGPYEYTEATNKARAVLSAIAAAETLRNPDTPVDDAGHGG